MPRAVFAPRLGAVDRNIPTKGLEVRYTWLFYDLNFGSRSQYLCWVGFARWWPVPNAQKAPTGRQMSPETKIGQRVWTPVYPTYPPNHPRAGKRIPNALPTDWVCPCGAAMHGGKVCPRCGRTILDGVKTITPPEHILVARGELPAPKQTAAQRRQGYERRQLRKIGKGYSRLMHLGA